MRGGAAQSYYKDARVYKVACVRACVCVLPTVIYFFYTTFACYRVQGCKDQKWKNRPILGL